MAHRSVLWIIGALSFALVSGGIAWGVQRDVAGDDPRAALAQCLTERGVQMYGAWWCPHCKSQKELFGNAFRHVDSIECALPGNARAQAPKCQQAKIEGYPTWVFPDGSRLTGEIPLEELAEKSGCAFSVVDR